MRYEVKTVWSPDVVMEQAKRHFGPQGAGLQVTSQNLLGIVFQGGGGYVAVTVRSEAKHTVVELETREWDYDVTRFMRRLPSRLPWWQLWRRRRLNEPSVSQQPFPILDQEV